MELRNVAVKHFKNTNHRDGTESLNCCSPVYAITGTFQNGNILKKPFG